jgi:hypothetical protein
MKTWFLYAPPHQISMAQPIFIKLGMYIKAADLIPVA